MRIPGRVILASATAMMIATQITIAPGFAQAASNEAIETTARRESKDTKASRDSNLSVNAKVVTKAIGPLHLSEGKVVIRQNQITVLSDAADSFDDAELTGTIINANIVEDASGNTMQGIAIFTKGFSLPAIEDIKTIDSIMCTDGRERNGHIEDVTSKILRIKTSAGTQDIATKNITSIKSPRAFAFSFPIATTSVSAIIPQATAAPSDSPLSSPAPPMSLAMATQSPADTTNTTSPSTAPSLSGQPGDRTLVSFSPTIIQDPNTRVTQQIKTLQAQLTEHHPTKRNLKRVAMVAGVAACFAIPAAIAVTCPRPKNLGQ